MANSIIKYTTTDNNPASLSDSNTFKDASGNVLTAISNEYVESEGCCILTLSGELSRIDGSYLFWNGKGNVTSVILPEGLKYISESFREFENLRSAEFPTTIETIQTNAFFACSSLKKLTFNGTVPPNAYGAFVGVGSYGVLYRPSGADYSTVMNSVNPDNPGDYVLPEYKLSNYGWVELAISSGEDTTLSVDLPTSIGVGRYIDVRPVTNSDGVISIILNGKEVGTVNSGDTYSLQIPKEGTNKIVIKIEATDSYNYYANEYTVIGIETSLDFTVEGNPNYEGNELSITPTSNSDGSIAIEYIKGGSSTLIGTCHTDETIKWTVPSIGKYTIKCEVFETPIYNGKTITKEYESSEKEYPNVTIKVNGYDLNGDNVSEPYFVGYTLKIYAYKNGSIIFDDEYSIYVNGVALQGYTYNITEAGELTIKVVVPATETSYVGTAFTTINVYPDIEPNPNTLTYNLTKKYNDGNFYIGDNITISGLGGQEDNEKVKVYANDILIGRVSRADGGQVSWYPEEVGTYVFKQVADDGTEEYLHEYVGSTQLSRNYVLTVKAVPEKIYKLYYKISDGKPDPYQDTTVFSNTNVVYHTFSTSTMKGELWFFEKIVKLNHKQPLGLGLERTEFESFKIDDVDEIEYFDFEGKLIIGNNVNKVTKLSSDDIENTIIAYNSKLTFATDSLISVNDGFTMTKSTMYIPSDFDETTLPSHDDINVIKYAIPSVSFDIIGEQRIGHILKVNKNVNYDGTIFKKANIDYTLVNEKGTYVYNNWTDDYLYINTGGGDMWVAGVNTITPKVIFYDEFSKIYDIEYDTFTLNVLPKREERCIVKYLVQEANKSNWQCKDTWTTYSPDGIIHAANPLLADQSRWDGNWYIAKYENEVGAFTQNQIVSYSNSTIQNNYVEGIIFPEGFEEIPDYALGAYRKSVNSDRTVLYRLKFKGDTAVNFGKNQYGTDTACGQNTDKQKFLVIVPDGNETEIPRLTSADGKYYKTNAFWGWTDETTTKGWWIANNTFNIQMHIDYLKQGVTSKIRITTAEPKNVKVYVGSKMIGEVTSNSDNYISYKMPDTNAVEFTCVIDATPNEWFENTTKTFTFDLAERKYPGFYIASVEPDPMVLYDFAYLKIFETQKDVNFRLYDNGQYVNGTQIFYGSDNITSGTYKHWTSENSYTVYEGWYKTISWKPQTTGLHTLKLESIADGNYKSVEVTKDFYCDPKINDVDDEVTGSKNPWFKRWFYRVVDNGEVTWENNGTSDEEATSWRGYLKPGTTLYIKFRTNSESPIKFVAKGHKLIKGDVSIPTDTTFDTQIAKTTIVEGGGREATFAFKLPVWDQYINGSEGLYLEFHFWMCATKNFTPTNYLEKEGNWYLMNSVTSMNFWVDQDGYGSSEEPEKQFCYHSAYIPYTTTDKNKLNLTKLLFDEEGVVLDYIVKDYDTANDYGNIKVWCDDSVHISNNFFKDQHTLKRITFPNEVTSLGLSSLRLCDALETVKLGNNVNTVDSGAFCQCRVLNKITIDTFAEPKCTMSSFYGVKEYGTLEYPVGSNYDGWLSEADYYLGFYHWNHTESEGDDYDGTFTTFIYKTRTEETVFPTGKFYDANGKSRSVYSNVYENGVGKLTINGVITKIGYRAFFNNQFIEYFEVPEGITEIGEQAFACPSNTGVSYLSTIKFPSSLTKIGDKAFFWNSRLNTIFCEALTAPTIYRTTFYEVKPYGTLHYPKNTDYSSWLSTDEYYLGYYMWNGSATDFDKELPELSFYIDGVNNLGEKVAIKPKTNSTGLITIKVNGNVIGTCYNGGSVDYTFDQAGNNYFEVAVAATDKYSARSVYRTVNISVKVVLKLDPEEFVVDFNAQSVTSNLTLRNARSIKAVSDSDWAVPEPITIDSTSIKINIAKLEDDNIIERDAVITVSAETIDTSPTMPTTATIRIKQSKEYIVLEPNRLRVDYQEQFTEVLIKSCNVKAMSVVSNVSWCKASLFESNAGMMVSFSKNSNVIRRGVVTVTGISKWDRPLKAVLHVVQLGNNTMRISDGLYIDGNKCDLETSVKVAMTYAATDTESPEAVKNNYSKTVELKGTKNNNKIFADFWKLDRSIIEDGKKLSEVHFDPKQRVPFVFYDNGTIIENGYISLDGVSMVDGMVKYSVTLYGGLGDFFYSLMYNEEGEEKTLSDMYYGFVDGSGNAMTKEDEKNKILITWNKEYIMDSWGYLYSGKDHNGYAVNTGTNSMNIKNCIVPVPTYSGIYDDFDNNKVLVSIRDNGSGGRPGSSSSDTDQFRNALADTLFPRTLRDDSNSAVTYSTKFGYGLMELPRDFVEWETRDLRSYYQRPAIRTKVILDAITNPENNGGYEVVWDSDINDVNTPLGKYYDKSYILMDRIDFEDTDENEVTPISWENNTNPSFLITTATDKSIQIYKNKTTEITYDFSDFNDPKIEMCLSPMFIVPSASGNPEKAYTSYCFGEYRYQEYISYRGGGKQWVTKTGTNHLTAGYVFRLEAYKNGVKVSESNNYFQNCYGVDSFYNKVERKNGWSKGTGKMYKYNKSQIDWSSYGITSSSVIETANTLKLNQGVTNAWYTFEQPVKLKMSVPANSTDITFKLVVRYVYGVTYDMGDTGNYAAKIGVSSNNENNRTPSYTSTVTAEMVMYDGEDDDEYINGTYNSASNVVQSVNCKKSTIFRNSGTPFAYLLGFTRLFNLRYRVDNIDKKVYITKRGNYYEDKIIDITNKIDRKKGIKITPTTSEYKWYSYTLETPESYAAKLYKKKYGLDYGEYKLNTNYFFNAESNNLFEDNIYRNVVDYRLQSPYFQTNKALGSTGYAYPTIGLVPHYTWKLWHVNDGTYEDYEADKYGCQSYGNVGKVYDWPKLCCFDSDNSNVTDIVNAFIFFDGTYTTSTPYQITDNIDLMNTLNDNTPCYLYAPSTGGDTVTGKITPNEDGIIAYNVRTLPVFSKNYKGNSLAIQASFDFAAPKALYVDASEYNGNATIYNGFWKGYIEDLYDKDAKKVEVYYFLNENPKDAMRKFYFFDNSIWVLNDVTDWDPRSTEPTRCTFIKVKSKTNYLS